ncbi:MAG: amidohydrolase/deacetylase family metallohydrolase [Thaumarchaeota archaeon]|nr:amidohydrolase/deacetylase family metallohydrolase [Nitrososphaerota archaeon]
MYELVISGGTLIDPARGINEKMDVAVSAGRVAEVARSISPGRGRRHVDASGKIVTPGFIDMHTHVAKDIVKLGVDPETYCLQNGSTTVVDAGSTGELNFVGFKKYVIGRSKTRILAFVNVESLGMVEFNDSPANTDQKWPLLITAADDQLAPLFVNKKNLIALLRRNKGTVVGIKWAHHGFNLLEIAREVADETPCRVMSENHFMPDALRLLKKGDIITHAYQFSPNRVNNRRDGLTEDGKTIHPEVFQAVKRGVLLDVGHGKGSFTWLASSLALKEGLPPNTISTDLWIGNVNGPVFDLPTTMSKFLHLGMGLEEVVAASTSGPAAALGKEGELGTLKPHAPADITVMSIVEGRHPLVDAHGVKKMAERRIVVTDVVRGGEVVKTSNA